MYAIAMFVAHRYSVVNGTRWTKTNHTEIASIITSFSIKNINNLMQNKDLFGWTQ